MIVLGGEAIGSGLGHEGSRKILTLFCQMKIQSEICSLAGEFSFSLT